MLKSIFHLNKRPLAYAILLGVGFLILAVVREVVSRDIYLVWVFILYLIVLLELFVTANHFHVEHRKNSKKKYKFEDHHIIQYAHHVGLPSMLYFGLTLLLYYFDNGSLYLLLVIIGFILFVVLYENIHSFYRHEFSIYKSTNYIYDLISVFIVYLWSNILLQFGVQFNASELQVLLLLMLMVGIIGLLSFFRHSFVKTSMYVLASFLLVLVWVVFGMLFFGVSNQVISFVISLLFTLLLSYENYYLEKSINKSALIEYCIVILILFALISLYGV